MKLSMGGLVALIGISFVLSACGISNEDINSIQTGDVVSVDYRVSRSDGTLISDSTLDNETSLRGSGLGEEFASSFNAGDDNILRGEAVVGASSGSILTGTIDPAITQDERFYDRNRIQRVPLNAFIEELKPSINDVIMLGDSYGTVTAIEGDEGAEVVIVDLNARSLRDTYNYTVTVTSVIDSVEE